MPSDGLPLMVTDPNTGGTEIHGPPMTPPTTAAVSRVAVMGLANDASTVRGFHRFALRLLVGSPIAGTSPR
jgi:hypothetical protein